MEGVAEVANAGATMFRSLGPVREKLFIARSLVIRLPHSSCSQCTTTYIYLHSKIVVSCRIVAPKGTTNNNKPPFDLCRLPPVNMTHERHLNPLRVLIHTSALAEIGRAHV